MQIETIKTIYLILYNIHLKANSYLILIFLKFLGAWYVMEYVYNKPMRVNDLSCIGFEFSINANEDGLEKLKANFTFKFPAKTGYFYHVPTYSPVNTINPAIWDTQTRRGKYSFCNRVILCCENIFLSNFNSP